jgi:hypothetical protein
LSRALTAKTARLRGTCCPRTRPTVLRCP